MTDSFSDGYYVPPDVRPWWLTDDDFDPEQEDQRMARGIPDDAPAIDPEDVIDMTHLPGEDADPADPVAVVVEDVPATSRPVELLEVLREARLRGLGLVNGEEV